MKTPKPEPKVEKSHSNLVRIGILLASLIVGVILALFTMSNNPN
ncbi:MAG TPA: hypothetical protein VLL94_01790 [Nitrospiraceae bacterium]|jgi:hypothetical protein|nr:hypothetical protein [Nitrospiraceae bacterium]HSQ49979.1 hypothetical protein [Nitrospiraceae bacterium]